MILVAEIRIVKTIWQSRQYLYQELCFFFFGTDIIHQEQLDKAAATAGK
jgi:hypothetical protein